MLNKRLIMRNLLVLWLVILTISTVALAFASRPFPSVSEEFVSEAADDVFVEPTTIDKACEMIYQGNFEQTRELLAQNFDEQSGPIDDAVDKLLKIVDEYQAIRDQRKQDKEDLYAEKVAELNKFRAEIDINDIIVAISEAAYAYVGTPTDQEEEKLELLPDESIPEPNDANDIVDVLAAIANVSGLADKQQRQQLLSDVFVQEVLQVAIDKATHMEVQGNWLESYTNCYAWLVAIDPNNKGYSDYAQTLYDKAVIAASLEDSPCETRQERYKGVKREIFVRAIGYLELYYVNEIDYNEMTAKAIERCQLLGEVMKFRAADFNEPAINQRSQIEYEKALSTWSKELEVLTDTSNQSPEGINIEEFMVIFENVIELNETTMALPREVLISHFADGALSSLDPYTVIVWPQQVENFEKSITNEFSGIGIEISKPRGLLTVASLLPDTPAYRAGLDAGDVIEAVDGIETKDLTLTCAVRKITGPRGTQVTLTIRKPDTDQTKEVVITRDKIVVPTIRGWQRTEAGQWLYMIDQQSKIGYVRLTSFSADSKEDLDNVLTELEAEGMNGLILDLRFNTGGFLESAVDVADLFLQEGVIVRRQPRLGKLPIYEYANKKGTHPDYPFVLLVNSSSASASEIVAGALADKAHNRAVLVGARTHGKGSVQGITNVIGNGAELRYTIAYYHLPSGQRVESRETMEKLGRNDWGVGPNIEVELSGEELTTMIDVQRDNDVLVQADHDNANDELKKHTLEDTLLSDGQLAVALLVVKSKLIQAEAQAVAVAQN